MDALEQARQWVKEAGPVVVLTGAGVSAESGVPTFRGADGLWKQFRAEELATPEAFARDPVLVWEWYDWRRCRIAEVEPNAAHRALAELERRKERFALVTQNVDGLHDRAGSRQIYKLHGDIWTLRCARCGRETRDERAPLPGIPPRCECGGFLRPGVVWFGESLPVREWEGAERAIREAELVLVVGTSAVVYPAAGLIGMAARAGTRVVEVNLDETPYSGRVDLALRGKAGELLPEMLA
jgi:NAD-dependent deacetylase